MDIRGIEHLADQQKGRGGVDIAYLVETYEF
jgi:hypothetical protein